jgi:predicted GH43/DUF377 family glycosyl hydrolase
VERPNPIFWEDYLRNLTDHIIDPKDPYETNYIGGGLPPIETPCGWLLIYHGVNETATGKVYHAKAALFHLEKPEMELSRLPYPLFSPTKKWEKRVSLIMLCFLLVMPCLDDLYIYYGAAVHIAVAKVSLTKLLDELKKTTINTIVP